MVIRSKYNHKATTDMDLTRRKKNQMQTNEQQVILSRKNRAILNFCIESQTVAILKE